MASIVKSENSLCGLVLSGGGARAAYQVGALRGLAEILNERHKYTQIPFRIYTGESAGAINSSVLASNLESFPEATKILWEYWENIRFQDVFETGALSVLTNATKWIRELGFGGAFRSKNSVALLDSSPLADFLKNKIQLGKISGEIDKKNLHGFSVSTTNYATGTAITFYDGDSSIRPWVRAHRLGVRAKIKMEHILASAAIPILFPPVKIGQTYYGDGSVRQKTPLSPAIHLGAEKVFAIGSRHLYPLDHVESENKNRKMTSIALADVAGVLLNAGFLDNLDGDAERMERINQTLSILSAEKKKDFPSHLRFIPLFTMRPSRELALMAWEEFDRFNSMLRYLLRGIGASRASGWDLVSYLAFDSSYTKKLLALGYHDALDTEKHIVKFFLNK